MLGRPFDLLRRCPATEREASQDRRLQMLHRLEQQLSVRHFRKRFVEGMCERGYPRKFVENCFRQIEGFGEYGFPESHAASFALLVYISAWIKCHRPDAFLAGLLNSQPMGFYAPAQLVQDARRHGVEVRPADVCISEWDCTLEDRAVRLGLRMVGGLSEEAGKRIVDARPYRSV